MSEGEGEGRHRMAARGKWRPWGLAVGCGLEMWFSGARLVVCETSERRK